MAMRCPGEVIGTAGGSLSSDASWALNKDVVKFGRKGELLTAAIIDPLCLTIGGPTVLHDVQIPIPGFSGVNIDHLIVCGTQVLLVDSKVWRPGKYRTSRGKSRIDGVEADHLSKKTMEMARDSIARYLAKQGLTARFATPIIVVWPSSKTGRLDVRKLVVPGAKAMHADVFQKKAKRIVGRRQADSNIVRALLPLVKKASAPKRTTSDNFDDWAA